MASLNRRRLLQTALAAAVWPASAQTSTAPKKMRLGVIIGISPDPAAAIRRVHELGFPTCQVSIGATDDATLGKLRDALQRYAVEATSAVAGGPGPEIYNFYDGPRTIGLVPPATRAARIAHMKTVSDFAKKAGIPAVQGHCGFIPENPRSGRVLQGQRPEPALRDRAGDADHAGARHPRRGHG
jgi:sugar phosphate isomerase/epimerase